MLGLECSTVPSRDMDVDSREKVRSNWNMDLEKNGKDQLAWQNFTNEMFSEE